MEAVPHFKLFTLVTLFKSPGKRCFLSGISRKGLISLNFELLLGCLYVVYRIVFMVFLVLNCLLNLEF